MTRKAPLVTPAPGSFLGWSARPRVCPGQKMSQVEFVGVVSTLLRKCSVAPVVGAGETPQQARDRLLEVLRDSQPELTLRMNRPTDIHLHWTRRFRIARDSTEPAVTTIHT
ncbi:hypothetical protein B0T24DRAFT_719812 [Lasiosphaeria ovina]|uniref:Cytochrome P450 n=1 Tax=Lasiosphaeria ovina TaxID=92902 RepID=A0AAE0KBK0_9PEZI|nr:hypothetical protein B0T24DRAFT_719812 [Lasiosphaeria ovina]